MRRRAPGRNGFRGREWLSLLLILAAGLAATGTTAAGDAPMRFAVVRSLDNDCEPTCPEWIMADGPIDAKAPARLKALLKLTVGRRLPLLITSGGGDPDAAMALGRVLRKSRLSVVVGRTALGTCLLKDKDCKGARYLGRAFSTGAVCRLACVLALAGGSDRIAGAQAYIGRLDGKTGAKAGKRIAAYLKEMGVDKPALDAVQGKSFGMNWLRQLRAAALLTQVSADDPLWAIIGPSACTAVPALDNCRVLTVDD